MNEEFLEKLYETVILPRYKDEIDLGKVRWVSHGKVDLDAWAHYFQVDSKAYALLYEDYPDGSYFKDGLSHEVVKLGDEFSIELKYGDVTPKQIPNILGWYTLFREKDR
jgi:hypothetical protein